MSGLKLYDIITESKERDMFEGFNETELGEDYPAGFDIFNFKNINGYSAKLRYAKSYLGKPIGSGTARVVYRVDNDKVLKLAKNKKGIAQNEVEINWSGDNYYGDVMARIFDYDRDDSLWVEMELAFRVKESDFKRLWGIDLSEMYYYLRNKYEENNGRRSFFHVDPEINERLNNNDHVQHLLEFILDSDANPGDLGKLSTWGLVRKSDGESLVLIDFGLTNDVYESYYR